MRMGKEQGFGDPVITVKQQGYRTMAGINQDLPVDALFFSIIRMKTE